MEKTRVVLKTRVKALRDKAELSQEALASLAGLSTQTIKDIEAGRTPGGMKSLKKLSEAFGISFEELTGEAEPTPNVIREPFKISSLADTLKKIPNEVYEMANGFDLEDEVWEMVASVMRKELELKLKKQQKKKHA